MSDLPAIKYLDKAAKAAGYDDWGALVSRSVENSTVRYSVIAHARALEALAKYEPEPVDGDEAAVKRILCAFYGSKVAILGPDAVDRALAQYKAERPTITDDEALLIAREIAASFANYWGARVSAEMARSGSHDGSNPQKFALAMVKRDPAALEAFRGVGRGI